jgi:hypothetical protein
MPASSTALKIPIPEAQARSDANLAAYLRHAALHAPGGAVSDDGGAILYAGAHPNPAPYINGLLRLDAGVAPEDALARADAFFAPLKRSYAVWIRGHADDDLESAVLARGFWCRPPPEGQPGIAVDHPLAAAPLADNVAIRRVDDDASTGDYLSVLGDAYGMEDSPAELVWAQFLQPEALLAAQVAARVVYAEGVPAAVSMCFVEGDTAGLYWAARSSKMHGRGFGAAAAVASINGAFELGAELVTAQSSARGTRLWLSIGFEEITRYRRYVGRPGHRPPTQ